MAARPTPSDQSGCSLEQVTLQATAIALEKDNQNSAAQQRPNHDDKRNDLTCLTPWRKKPAVGPVPSRMDKQANRNGRNPHSHRGTTGQRVQTERPVRRNNSAHRDHRPYAVDQRHNRQRGAPYPLVERVRRPLGKTIDQSTTFRAALARRTTQIIITMRTAHKEYCLYVFRQMVTLQPDAMKVRCKLWHDATSIERTGCGLFAVNFPYRKPTAESAAQRPNAGCGGKRSARHRTWLKCYCYTE